MESILDWPTPAPVNEVSQFFGLADFYRRFIQGYADLVQLISDLMRTESLFWDESQVKAFAQLKETLTNATVLSHPLPENTFFVCIDASRYAFGAALEQNGHTIAYISHRLSDAKVNGILVTRSFAPS